MHILVQAWSWCELLQIEYAMVHASDLAAIAQSCHSVIELRFLFVKHDMMFVK